jgi:23S rRNA (cytidine1920-2'-O)/16S rRNA (cytidine1409-2'-O)-methyltransferase
LDYISSSGFKGVVRGRDKHETILLGVLSSLETLLPDWRLQGLDYSPITGPKGNIEFLVYWIRSESSLNSLTGEPLKHRVQEILEESYRNLSC